MTHGPPVAPTPLRVVRGGDAPDSPHLIGGLDPPPPPPPPLGGARRLELITNEILEAPTPASPPAPGVAPETARPRPLTPAQIAELFRVEKDAGGRRRDRVHEENDAPVLVPLDESLSLDRNLALMAGAGAGKTYNLVTICLHLLSGARPSGEPIQCSQLCLLTFTDKAAAELLARLRARLEPLANGDASPTHEKELRTTFAQLDRPFPPRETWRRIRDDLGSAIIGTFHGLCVQLLRRAPGGFGVDPAFRLLEERDAAALVHDVAQRLVLDAVEAGEDPVVDLCRELNFTGEGRVSGLVEYLCQVFAKVREEGISPLDISITPERGARADFDEARLELEQLVSSALSVLPPNLTHRFGPVLRECREALDGMSFDNFLEPNRFPRLRRAALADRTMVNQTGAIGELLKQVKWRILGHREKAIQGLGERYGACIVVPHERAFIGLLARLQERHREEMSRRGALDFSELLIRTRDLLRDWPAVRAEVQQRIRALLVDEFQDTNRLQLELVMLLAEKREGAPRPISLPLGADSGEPRVSEVLDLPLEPAFLCAVGDRKQSIYEFRGADVSVFGILARKIEAEGGGRAYLKRNWRSTPQLLELFNRVFAQLMRPKDGARDYEVAYEPEGDDLDPVRVTSRDGPCADRLVFEPGEDDDAERCRLVDADAVARHVHALLSGAAGFSLEGGARVRGGDIAILFRRFTYLETYRQALTRYGIPHRVVRGRGFYGAQEVLDLASLLSLVADPSDAVSFAAVLRSPLVALSDASLFKLARAHERLGLEPLLTGPEAIAALELPLDERSRLERLLKLYPDLRAEKDRLGVRALLKVALEETGYRVAIAGAPFGEQALANLEKLAELAGRWDADGTGDCAAFARELLSLADGDPTEAQADVLDALDRRAVQLLTIHQAKGLEWPVVVVPDLGAKRKGGGDRIVFDRQQGLAIKPWLGDQDIASHSPRFREVSAELKRREDAEYKRLLYVALTRAKDRLVLSGAARGGGNTWWKMLDVAIAQDERVRALVRDVKVSELRVPAPNEPPEAPVTPEAKERVERAVARARSPAPLKPRSVVLPVTHLQDFERCPRRYYYAHLIGLSEYPVVFDLDEDAGLGRSSGDSRFKGTVAHRLLERVSWAKVGTEMLRGELEALLWEEGMDPASNDGREILGWVEGFLSTRFAANLARSGEGRVHRELPFLLRLSDGELALSLKGQIDLLFEDEGTAVLVDYKASHRPESGLLSYAFQLDCYALAACRFVAPGVQVRTGIAFLRERVPEPELCGAEVDAPALERRLLASARELLGMTQRREWPGREKAICDAISCGYRYRCHPTG